jgi:tRNA threonylcarbamoyladenosine biosynthesis protein TsaE
MDSFCIVSHGLNETEKIAINIARLFKKGDLVILSGDLACGKTYFVKFFAKSLGSSDLVTSPTYSIANFYNTENEQLLHIDVYRLSDLKEFHNLGLDEFMCESITVVEWGEMIACDYKDHLMITFKFIPFHDDWRKISFSGNGLSWDNLRLLKKKLADIGHEIETCD